MTTHFLESWSQYLPAEDYKFLIQYVENVKNGIPNDVMIILYGDGRTGKSTLMRQIGEYLGNVLSGTMMTSGELIYSKYIPQLGFLNGLEGTSTSKKTSYAIANLIKYKQSFIAAVNNIGTIHPLLQMHSRVIYMTHVF